ncbi:LPXTG cell wall anchor domain-containing protein [Curtobacterium sp. APC 4022]|nr:LPXTG cell wall anchor domain-containing protein [Curtobacterium sp. APC 4022]MDN3478585.1 LPXTG cell wall anchor domain-containing protein [Curtobacterium sp. APC 4022]
MNALVATAVAMLAAVSPKTGATIPLWAFVLVIVAIVAVGVTMFLRRKR